MNVDRFSNLGPAWINNLRIDIEEKTAQKEDVELMMEYYNQLYESDEGIPLKELREILRLMNQVFKEYLNRKAKRQFYGSLDAAFGLTRKQGDRNIEQRNEDLATAVARYRLQQFSVTNAVMKVSAESGLSRTVINEAWRKNKEMAYIRVQLEYRERGKPMSEEKFKIVEKDLRKIKQALEEFRRFSGK